MNSFILISRKPDQQEAYLKDFIESHAISPFDVTTIAEEGSIGIEVVRKLQEKLFLKPYKGKEKVIVIERAENTTVEAQNALLKLLEEPPIYTYIFLVSTTEEIFLPTILSRCKIIKLSRDASERELDTENLENDITVITAGTLGEKLALAEKLAAEKEKLSQWFSDITIYLRENMIGNINDKEKTLAYAQILNSLQEGYKIFSTTNVNPRIILEHIFLTI